MELGQIFTRQTVANFMVSLCEIGPNDFVLDPCFGAGVFLNEIDKKTKKIYGCEIDKELFNKSSKKYNNYIVPIF